MKNFLGNLVLLTVLGIVIFLVAPDMTRQVFGLYNGLGILPIILVMVILAALPRRKVRRRK